MAKALFGHVGGPDPRMVSEMRRLQQRVRDLEAELMRLQGENDVLAAEAARSEDMLVLDDREPALA
jgi:cell division protein FtsB